MSRMTYRVVTWDAGRQIDCAQLSAAIADVAGAGLYVRGAADLTVSGRRAVVGAGARHRLPGARRHPRPRG
ncbi:hypothetical protein Acy02nite_90750 [Actinoplanes cyaneus]|uniref:Uncharacterized protein n=1 Tax=Actinoplanes cyaneus TaxID=52696 RepID=A0A919MD01_9ACTN|nr:hypothetical protein Acy02nite_90750 [Actinoplanes cyaneus]